MLLIVDDRKIAAPPVSDLIGRRRFGDVLLKRKRLADWLQGAASDFSFERTAYARSDDGLREAMADAMTAGMPVLLLPGPVWIRDRDSAQRLLRRLKLGGLDALVRIGQQHALFSANGMTLAELLRTANGATSECVVVDGEEAFVDLDDYRQCLAVLSNAFEVRHFNSMRTESLEVVKHSSDLQKIKAEHDFWHRLPEAMRRWFVMPYGLKMTESAAEYRMERLQVADIALQWVHGGVQSDEFEDILGLLSSFLRERPRREVPPARQRAMQQALYVDKVESRVATLMAHPYGKRLQQWLSAGTRYSSLNDIVAHYLDLRRRVDAAIPALGAGEAISHGDLCFSNILYERHARLFKLIDPRGATSDQDMWTDPSYDWAKLSHSVLGDYDFINNDQFRLEVDGEDRLRLSILSHEGGLQDCKQHFIVWLQEHGQHPVRVRLDEASLFLSMLPLHLDRPHRVLAFLINAADILNDIESNLGHTIHDHH